MFNITIDTSKKILKIELSGFFNEQEGQAFLNEYNSKLRTIIPKDYNLVVLGSGLNVLKREIVPTLQKSIKLYESSNFKEIYGVVPTSPTAAMQLKRTLRECNFNGKFIKSESEII